MPRLRRVLALSVLLLYVAFAPAPLAGAGSTTVVISQVYGGGGNAGATFRNDFIELHNRGTSAVDLNGWSVQYRLVCRQLQQRQPDEPAERDPPTGPVLPRTGSCGSRRLGQPADTRCDREHRDGGDGRQGGSREQHDGAGHDGLSDRRVGYRFRRLWNGHQLLRRYGTDCDAQQHHGGDPRRLRVHRYRFQQRGLLHRRAESSQYGLDTRMLVSERQRVPQVPTSSRKVHQSC